MIEHEGLSYWQLETSEPEFNQTYTGGFGAPKHTQIDVPIDQDGNDHKGITQNFVDAILHGEPLIAPGQEGIYGLTLSNAMQLSTWTDSWVHLPIDEQAYEQQLKKRIHASTGKKNCR